MRVSGGEEKVSVDVSIQRIIVIAVAALCFTLKAGGGGQTFERRQSQALICLLTRG